MWSLMGKVVFMWKGVHPWEVVVSSISSEVKPTLYPKLELSFSSHVSWDKNFSISSPVK